MALRDNISTYQTGVYAVTRTPRGPLVHGQHVAVPPIDLDVTTVVPFDSMFPATTNLLNIPAHGLATGAGPVWLTTTVTFPAGLPSDGLTASWAIAVDDDNIRLAASKALALADTALVITDVGAGALHVSSTFLCPASVRPLEGDDLDDLIEGQRSDHVQTVYSLVPLNNEDGIYEPDIIVIEGKRHRVTKLTYYIRNDFYKAIVEKLELH